MWYIHSLNYYSAIIRNEKRQTLYYDSIYRKYPKYAERLRQKHVSGCQRLGREMGNDSLVWGFTVGAENVLEVVRGDGCTAVRT